MFGQVLKQWFWDTYDHLGRLLLLNLLLVLIAGPILFYSGLLLLSIAATLPKASGLLVLAGGGFLVTVISTTFVFSGLLWFGWRVSEEKDPPARDFLSGIVKCGRRVGSVVLCGAVIALVLLANLWWYFFSGTVPGPWRFGGYVLGGLCLWLLLIVAGVLAHTLPLAVRTGHSLWTCFKLGTLATLKYPILTLTVLLFITVVLTLGTFLKLAGLLIYGFVLPAMVINSLHDVIAAAEARASRRTDAAENRPTSWRQIQEAEGEEEEERLDKARYDRGWADLLRPWEM